jgi:hypothetical protein
MSFLSRMIHQPSSRASVHHALYSILEKLYVEIHEQPQFATRKTEIGNQLCFVNR